MLRLPAFELLRPTTLDAALALLAEHGERAMPIAGGTDLLPNMKHKLFEPEVLVSLAELEELRGVRRTEDGGLALGAMTRGAHYTIEYPGVGGYLLWAATAGAVFLGGAKILDAIRYEQDAKAAEAGEQGN